MNDNNLAKLSSGELERMITAAKTELSSLESALFDAKIREHDEKYVRVRVEGCTGCTLENYRWNASCDHCDGYHYEDKLRS